MLFSNADEELQKLKTLKAEIEEINALQIDKLFVTVEDIQRIFGCCERRAREFMNLPGLNVVKLGKEPLVNINVLNEFTQQRIVLSEMKKNSS